MTTVSELGREKFVSVTTYRKSGAAVATPVWAVADGDDLLVWTPSDSGKVKRVRHNPRVDLAACSRRGVVAADAVRIPGTVEIRDDASALATVTAALKRDQGVEYRVVTLVEKAIDIVRRRHTPRVVLRISPLG